jgi:hypothetical protein
MSKQPKKTAAFRLSERTMKEISDVAKNKGVSQADVIAVLVHWFATGESDLDTLDQWFDIAARS